MATVTPTWVSDYTWDDFLYTWDSVTAGVKSWEGASIYDYDLSEDAAIAFAESPARLVELTFLDAFTVTSDSSRAYVLAVSRALAFAETYLDFINFNLTVNESLNIAEALAKDTTLATFEEAFALAESYANNVGLNKAEAVAFAELYSDSILFYMLAAETFSVADSLANNSTLAVEETLALVERYVRNADVSIGDVTIKNTALNAAGFVLAEASAPVGFGLFEKFYPGQRRFDSALFKTVLSGAATADKPRITALKVHVDIPEIGDAGSATLGASLTTIYFNKAFYSPPEVGAVHKGGSVVAVPNVSNITATSFDIKLEKASDGTVVAGDVSWTAYGS